MYSRKTELRHMQANDVYKLGVILDDNSRWKKLMEIIPKELNAPDNSVDGALKYNNDHMRLIENAVKRPGESRLFTQILLDEWGTSGQECERPNLGILLQLLVKAELFRAADYVALNYLNEPPPKRPLDGPAAHIDISLPSVIFEDIDIVNDFAMYPDTEALNDNTNYSTGFADKQDFLLEYRRASKCLINYENSRPVPPPRTLRSARLLQQKQQQPRDVITTNENTTVEAVSNSVPLDDQQQFVRNVNIWTEQLPKVCGDQAVVTESKSTNHTQNILLSSYSADASEPPIPMISALDASTEAMQSKTSNFECISNASEVLPVISALNLNGERDGITLGQHSIDEIPKTSDNKESNSKEPEQFNDYDKDEDDSCVPNLSIFDQRSSNNDSSLTNITGTSGENSFELSVNESSLASNDNIPCLSALKS